MPFTYYILVYLYYDAVILCCICMFYFSKYGGAINNINSGFHIMSALCHKINCSLALLDILK